MLEIEAVAQVVGDDEHWMVRWMLQQQKQGIKGVCKMTEKQRLIDPRSYPLV